MTGVVKATFGLVSCLLILVLVDSKCTGMQRLAISKNEIRATHYQCSQIRTGEFNRKYFVYACWQDSVLAIRKMSLSGRILETEMLIPVYKDGDSIEYFAKAAEQEYPVAFKNKYGFTLAGVDLDCRHCAVPVIREALCSRIIQEKSKEFNRELENNFPDLTLQEVLGIESLLQDAMLKSPNDFLVCIDSVGATAMRKEVVRNRFGSYSKGSEWMPVELELTLPLQVRKAVWAAGAGETLPNGSGLEFAEAWKKNCGNLKLIQYVHTFPNIKTKKLITRSVLVQIDTVARVSFDTLYETKSVGAQMKFTEEIRAGISCPL